MKLILHYIIAILIGMALLYGWQYLTKTVYQAGVSYGANTMNTRMSNDIQKSLASTGQLPITINGEDIILSIIKPE